MKPYRSSLERHNAPFRGTTRREDVVNFDLAVMHDLFHLQKISGGLDNFHGHKNMIEDNLSSLYYNEGEITASIPTAGSLVVKLSDIDRPLSQWHPKLNATLTPEHEERNTFRLISSTHQAGVFIPLKLNPGDIIALRLEIEAMENSHLEFALGTPSNSNEEDIDRYYISDFYNAPRIIEKRIYSDTDQQIELGIYGTWGHEGRTVLKLKNMSLSYLYEKETVLEGMDSQLKFGIRQTEKEIDSLNKRQNIFKEVFE